MVPGGCYFNNSNKPKYVKNDVIVQNVKPQSQVLSGPQESSSLGCVEKPWSGKLHTQATPSSTRNVSCKGKEKVGENPLWLMYH